MKTPTKQQEEDKPAPKPITRGGLVFCGVCLSWCDPVFGLTSKVTGFHWCNRCCGAKP